MLFLPLAVSASKFREADRSIHGISYIIATNVASQGFAYMVNSAIIFSPYGCRGANIVSAFAIFKFKVSI